MSGPYAYTPATNFQYNEYHQTPYYYHTPRTYTPFLPPPLSLPGSPRYTTALPTPVTPGSPGHIPFPSASYEPDYDPGFVSWNGDPRPRRPSWHGPPNSADFLHPTYQFQNPYPRRHSFSYQQPTPWSAPAYSSLPQELVINPFINASKPRFDFYFDLSLTHFAPLRLFGPGQSIILPSEELQQPATHPPLTRLRIICDRIPDWPIDLEYRQPNTAPYSPYSPTGFALQQQPPITLSDVLVAVHQSMHRLISHRDWAKLGRHDERTITNAYTRRCTNEQERAQGVKRVDYLLGKTRMVGLVRSGVEDGCEVMRLILTER